MRSISERRLCLAVRLTAFTVALVIALLVAWPRPVHAADVPIDGLAAVNSSPTVKGNTTFFTATVSAGTSISYTWDFGDNSSGNDMTAGHTYTASGVYTATVTATNDGGMVEAKTVVYIGDALVDVGPGGQFIFSPRDVTIPPGGTVVWTLRSGFHSVTADIGDFEQPLGSDWLHYAHTFPDDAVAATVQYHCIAHGAAGGSGMAGSVIISAPPSNTHALRMPFLYRQ